MIDITLLCFFFVCFYYFCCVYIPKDAHCDELILGINSYSSEQNSIYSFHTNFNRNCLILQLITLYNSTSTYYVLNFFPLKSSLYFIGCKVFLTKGKKMWVMVFLKKIPNSVITKDVLKWHEYFCSRWVSFRGQVVKRKPSHTLHQHRGMRDQCIYWAMDFQWAYKLIGGWTCPRSNDFKVIAGSVNCADLHCVSLIADLTNEQFRGIQAWTLFHVPWMACQRSLFLTSFIFVQSALNL